MQDCLEKWFTMTEVKEKLEGAEVPRLLHAAPHHTGLEDLFIFQNLWHETSA